MSFREKIAWISLLTTAAVYGWYFAAALPALGDSAQATSRLHVTVLLIAVLQAVPAILISARSPREAQAPQDERERLIALKGSRAGYVVLGIGALVSCVAGLYFGIGGVLLANAILFAFVLSQLAKYGAEILYHRRGF